MTESARVKIIIPNPATKQLIQITLTLPKIPERNHDDNSPVISPEKEQKQII